jgi:hypothetical protein
MYNEFVVAPSLQYLPISMEWVRNVMRIIVASGEIGIDDIPNADLNRYL